MEVMQQLYKTGAGCSCEARMNIQGGHYYLIRFVMEIDEERLLGPLFIPGRAFSDCFPQLFSFPPFTHCKRGRKGEKLLADILRLLLSTATLPEGVHLLLLQ